jgi:hypothetical protein
VVDPPADLNFDMVANASVLIFHERARDHLNAGCPYRNEARLPNCAMKLRSCISQCMAASHRFDRLKATAVKVEQAAPPAFEHCVRALKNFASAPSYVAAFARRCYINATVDGCQL